MLEIGIDERSSTFDLHVYSEHFRAMCRPDFLGDIDSGATVDVVERLSFAELRAIRDEIDRVLEYFDEQAPRAL